MAMGTGGNLALLLVAAGLAMADERQRPRPLSWLATKSVEAVDIDDVLGTIDVDALLQRIDLNALLADVDIQALLERVDLNEVLADVDLNVLLADLDVDALLADVDLDALLARVDVNALLDRVDPNPVLDRVEPNALLDRVDPNPLLDRVDADRLLDRVDVDRLMDRVDVPAIVDRAGIAEIVQESTGAVAGSALDVVRRTLVGLDAILESTTYRLTRRDPYDRPAGPPLLVADAEMSEEGRREVTGRYAGPVTRVAAFTLDFAILFWTFLLTSSVLTWVGTNIGAQLPAFLEQAWIPAVLFWMWFFLYWWIGLALTGRTIGKGVLGLRVVQNDGDPVTGRESAMRTLVMPLSFLTLFIGVVIVLVSPRRRTLHDWIAGTCEVYDWGERPAELPAPLSAWVAKRSARDDVVLPNEEHLQ